MDGRKPACSRERDGGGEDVSAESRTARAMRRMPHPVRVRLLPAPLTYNHPDQIRKSDDGVLYQFVRDNSACIYNNGHDICDHYNVQIEYQNGVIGTLLLDFSCAGKSVGRWLKIIGTRGVIQGKLEDNRIHLHDKRTDKEEIVELRMDESGHGGANDNHALAFARMLTIKPPRRLLASRQAI